MKQSIAICSAGLMILLISCTSKPGEQKEEKPLYDQVMDIHDEVMPSMGELNRLKRELKGKLENRADLSEVQRTEMEETIAQIDSASRGMMVWMREFNPEDYEGEALNKYLENEMKRVTAVKESILAALDEGRKANQ